MADEDLFLSFVFLKLCNQNTIIKSKTCQMYLGGNNMSKKNLKKLSTSIATVTIAAASGITPAMAQTSNRKTEIAEKLIEDKVDLSEWHIIKDIINEFKGN